MSRSWNSFDFIVNGEFADGPYIRQLVREIRIEVGADCCLLLVHFNKEFFRSLLYVSHRDQDVERTLQERMATKEPNDNDKQAIQKLLMAGWPGPVSELGLQLVHALAPVAHEMQDKRVELLRPDIQPRLCARLLPLIGLLCFRAGTA